ncbi:MAG: NADPH-dependent FMN reductase [Planctomycetota bacterium]
MIVVISGTNRPGSNTLRVARLCERHLRAAGEEVVLLDLLELPLELYQPESYAQKPAAFARFQGAIDACQGVLTVVPEYNGSFPGALKYFLDMLAFPGSLRDVPASFVGLASGRWGALRAVEQLQHVFQYRLALLYPDRTFISQVTQALDDAGELLDPALAQRLDEQLQGFARFARQNAGHQRRRERV